MFEHRQFISSDQRFDQSNNVDFNNAQRRELATIIAKAFRDMNISQQQQSQSVESIISNVIISDQRSIVVKST